jgi:bifunctional DNase/RNase
LGEVNGLRRLPSVIGGFEAQAIAVALENMHPSRPLTHDLMKTIISDLGSKVESVNLTHLADGVFYADVILTGGNQISARPSDAIALALRSGASIYATEELFVAAGIEIPDQADDQVEAFREFLDQINPEDFLG